MNSSLSVALPLQEAIVGALNIYATAPHSFDPDTIELARTFAGYAAVAIANAHLYPITATLADNMRRAMETRAVIEQAKGIVIAQQHCTPDTRPAPAARPCTARWRTKQRTRHGIPGRVRPAPVALIAYFPRSRESPTFPCSSPLGHPNW